MKKRSALLLAIVVAAALARLVPHPPNVTPIAAMALLGGACFRNRKLAYLLPLLAMLLSDLVLGCTRYRMLSLIGIQPVVYACILATTALGQLIQDRRSVLQVGAASLSGSILFFVVTNYAVWAMGHGYPSSESSLGACYIAAIPFFQNTLLGDLAYATILFGGLALLENRLAWMREPAPSVVA
jgi:hypothetical protein